MESFQGTERYRVVRHLGDGGMGVVYAVEDAEREGRQVALKMLRDQDAQALMRIKREFRSLSDVRHKNLVALYDLVADEERCFFTLELVDGVEFLTWLRPTSPRQADVPTGDLDAVVQSAPGAASGGTGERRLRDAFRQLVAGVHALHVNGRLHRDLKPSNVLVTPEGRVVILDFGLVSELSGTESISEKAGAAIVGTASYMAPEQGASGPVSTASDWYAVGVMLFQALTGTLPFEGAAMQVILEKQRRPAPSARDLVASVPADLDALCTRLLRISPHARPSPEELLRAFGAEEGTGPAPAPRDFDFVGREAELNALHGALARSRQGAAALVHVLGESGIGKSALIRRFLSEAEPGSAVVLKGRCYERETVPFKALDAIIDELARYLLSLPADKVNVLLPRDAHALARMFPVLQRVPAFRAAPARAIAEAQEQRRRATAALRELVLRMADRHPVVLVVDDAQWGDRDSGLVLEELLNPPDAPGVLVIVASRADETPLGINLQGPVTLRLAPLDRETTRALALRHTGGNEARAALAVEESAGNPFLLLQLAVHGTSGMARLEDVVAARVAALPPSARRLLDVVAVAGSPVLERVAAKVARVDGGDFDAVQALKSAHLVRGVGDLSRLETWHDRIRETVTGLLDAATVREIHAGLAAALQELPDADAEATAWHLYAAGMMEQASEASLSAARRAASLLAFGRAAVLYRRWLELVPPTDRRRRAVATQCADCLADAGRGPDAAKTYRAALEETGDGPVSDSEALELRRRAAEQLLRSGLVDEGLDAFGEVLAKVGMRLPKTALGAILGAAFRRLQLRVRGLGFVRTAAVDVPELTLRKIDVCWSVSMGLSMIDVPRGSSFQSKHLLLALAAGEPHRIARALAVEAGYLSIYGTRTEKRVTQLFAQARALAEELGDLRLLGLVDICGGLGRYLVGQWREAKALSLQAEQRFAEAGAAVSWEATTARVNLVWNHFFLGELREVARRMPMLLQDARARGDRYALTSYQVGLANIAILARGDSRAARTAVRDAMAAWSSRSYQFQHYWAMVAETFIDLYEGTPEDAWQRLEAAWPNMLRAQFHRIQNHRIESLAMKGRIAIATGRRQQAQDAIDRLESEKLLWARAFAAGIRSQLPGAPVSHLREAIAFMEGADMGVFARVARYRLARTDPSLAAEGQDAVAWMRDQGIADPDRFAEMLMPTWPRADRLPGSSLPRS